MSDQANSPSDHHLPEQIWSLILQKMPIKSILICTGVCKSWNSLIKSSYFISSHLNTSMSEANNTDSSNLCFFQGIDRFLLLYDDEEVLTEYARLIPPPFIENRAYSIFGSCNGLILLGKSSGYAANELFLLNPVLSKLVMLPDLNWEKFRYAGLGFDYIANDYIVWVLYLRRDSVGIYNFYSLNSNSWKFSSGVELESKYRMFRYTHANDPTPFVNGFFHVLATRSDDDSSIVLGFDVSGDIGCREILLPKVDVPPGFKAFEDGIYVCAGLLSISVTTLLEWSDSLTNGVFYIWVMKEYGVEESWTPLVKLPLDGLSSLPYLISFKKNGDALLAMDGGEHVIFNPRSNVIKKVEFRGKYFCKFFDCCYVQSLVLFDEGESYREEEGDSDLDEVEGSFRWRIKQDLRSKEQFGHFI